MPAAAALVVVLLLASWGDEINAVSRLVRSTSQDVRNVGAHAPRGLFRFLDSRPRRLPAAMSSTSSRTPLPSSSSGSSPDSATPPPPLTTKHSALAAGDDEPLNRLNTAAFRALAPPAPSFPAEEEEEPTDENAFAFSCQIPQRITRCWLGRRLAPSRRRNARQG